MLISNFTTMKTLLYSIITIFVLGIFTTSCNIQPSMQSVVLLQATGNNVSSALLSQTATVISNRLKFVNTAKFEVATLPEKSQIKVSLASGWDSTAVRQLFTEKGFLGFYETFNHQAVLEMLKGDNHLFELLKNQQANPQDAILGYATADDTAAVNSYVKTTPMVQGIIFAWSDIPERQVCCLYAVKSSPLLTDADIENVNCSYNQMGGGYAIEMMFKKPAIGIWADATKLNMNKAIAIMLDGKVLLAPIVMAEITGGHSSITGRFTQLEAKYIAAIVGNGELPVNLQVVK